MTPAAITLRAMEIMREVTLKSMSTYSPDEEVARKAPAVICAVASRTQRLRDQMEKLRREKSESLTLHEVEALLRDYLAPLPFEAELLSGNILKVDHAIRHI